MSDPTLTPTPEQRKTLEQIIGRELMSGEPLWPIMFAAIDAIGQRLIALEGGRPLHVARRLLRTGTYNTLRRANIATLEQLAEWTPEELMSLRNFGKGSLAEVREALAYHGMSLS